MAPVEIAAPMISGFKSDEVDSNAFAASFYLTPTRNATELAASALGARFALTEHLARHDCHLAASGGKPA
jgi:hypothetical protein